MTVPADDPAALIARVREQQKNTPPTATETAQTLNEAVQTGGIIICHTKCWACLADQHYEPPQAHPWADADDIEHARSTGRPEPTGNCGCYCAKEPTS